MELYNEKDVELVNDKIDNITEQIEHKKLELFEPTKKELTDINVIILQFVKDNKRKIYGGYAQNKAIVNKDPKDAFYREDSIPDIDIYSPEPIKDLINLCDILCEKGFKHVEGKEAEHKETYKVFANYANVCDLSYVPKNIYYKIPFIEIEGIQYTHPSFVYIDLYRILTDPYFSSRIWKKVFGRLYKLQKHYPFNKATKGLNNAYDVPKNKQDEVRKINDFILSEIKGKGDYIVVGQYAYNYFLKESGILDDRGFSKKYKIIDIPFMQMISTNYIPDAARMIINLKKTFTKITFTEFYPFWMFTGYNVVIYYDTIPILHITSHNRRCVQTLKTEKDIQIGCFDYVFLMNLISTFRAKVNNIEDKYHYHNIMTSHLIEIRNYYLKKNKLTLLDDSLFKSFIPDCVGETEDPLRENRLIREKKFKEGKLVIFRYKCGDRKEPPAYKFANTSGNEIRKPINLKLTKYVNNPELLSDFEKEEIEEDEVSEEVSEEI
jgi:hypothetical protein